jgi:hypothetical protein
LYDFEIFHNIFLCRLIYQLLLYHVRTYQVLVRSCDTQFLVRQALVRPARARASL